MGRSSATSTEAGREGIALAGRTWPSLAAGGPAPTLVVPLGSTEQHGPHLPLGTDTLVAEAVARRAAAEVGATGRGPAVVAPALPFGSSGEHADFPGTLSIGQSALELVVVELVRSADAFAGVVLVSGHAGNAEPLRRAVATARGEGRRVALWFPTAPGGDAHAGRTETSLVLALDPSRVRLELAEAGATAPVGQLLDELRRGGVAAISPNGVLGDPAGASAEEGEALLSRFAAEVAGLVDRIRA